MWEHPQHAVPGRDRPMEPWSAETGAERGASRSGLPEPVQWSGALAPVGARAGGQACVCVTCPAFAVLRWPKRRGPWPYAQRERGGPCPTLPAGGRGAWTGCRPSAPPGWGEKPPGAWSGARGAERLGRGRPPRGRRVPAAGPRWCPGHGPVGANGGGGGPRPGDAAPGQPAVARTRRPLTACPGHGAGVCPAVPAGTPRVGDAHAAAHRSLGRRGAPQWRQGDAPRSAHALGRARACAPRVGQGDARGDTCASAEHSLVSTAARCREKHKSRCDGV